MEGVKKCPKCNGQMDSGKLSGGAYTDFISDRIKGIPLFRRGSVKRVKAYMCMNCGYLELYGEVNK